MSRGRVPQGASGCPVGLAGKPVLRTAAARSPSVSACLKLFNPAAVGRDPPGCIRCTPAVPGKRAGRRSETLKVHLRAW